MKISLNGRQILELTDLQKKVIQNDISSDIFESDMIRRAHWCIDHPCRRHCDRMRPQWIKEAKERGTLSIPVDSMKIPAQFEDMSKYKENSVLVDEKGTISFSKEHEMILKNCICKNETSEEFIEKRIVWILTHKYERCLERLRKEWESKFASLGILEVPTNSDEFIQLVFAHPDYKSRSIRERDLVAARNNP